MVKSRNQKKTKIRINVKIEKLEKNELYVNKWYVTVWLAAKQSVTYFLTYSKRS